MFQKSMENYGCIPPSLGNYGLETCKDGSKVSMRVIHNLIDCPKPCAKYSMRLRTEHGSNPGILGLQQKSIKIILNEVIAVSYDQYSYIWLNLVAEVGGYVGLFLGFSVFQVTDIVEMLLQRNWIESFKSLLNRFKRSKD